MELSIIIPAYNRCAVLAESLEAIFQQARAGMEILVIDDGSTDETPALLARLEAPVPLRTFRKENQGPAAARNFALQKAEGEILLFLGQDILLQPGALEKHLETHRRYPEPEVAVLGKVTWKPPVTPFMEWLERSGSEFAFSWIREGWVDYRFGYTCNLSFKTAFLRAHGGFEERLPYGFEDVELSYRLQAQGLRIYYEPAILGLHDHPMDLAYSLERYRRIVPSARLFAELHPELVPELFAYALKPTLWNRSLLLGARALAPFWHLAQRIAWRWQTRFAYYEALKEAGVL